MLPEASSGFVTFFSSGGDGHLANGQAYTDFREALREYTIHIRCVPVTLVGYELQEMRRMYLCTRFFFWTPVVSIAYELQEMCRMYLCTRFPC